MRFRERSSAFSPALVRRPSVGKAISTDRSLLLSLLCVLGAILVLWLLLPLLFYLTVAGTTEKHKSDERLRVMELQQAQFAVQQRNIRRSAKALHDYRQSIRTLSELYQSGNYPELGKYLQQIIERMPAGEISVFCENPALNALLNYYADVAAQSGIALTLQIDLPEILPISDYDLCNMIGNLLDNSITACQKSEEKWIRLSVVAENGLQLFIVGVNSFDGIVRMKNGRFLSTNRPGEGVGLASITSTAEEYGGVAQFSCEGNRFFSNIAIPLTRSSD